MKRYMDENGNFVAVNPDEKKDLGMNKLSGNAKKHNDKAVEDNKTKTPIVEKPPKKSLLKKKKKKEEA